MVLPDETGRSVMFNYDNEAYVPQSLYAHAGGLSAVGISDRYEIALLDELGRTVKIIERDVKPRKISAGERDFLERGLADFVKSKSWPDRLGRELDAMYFSRSDADGNVYLVRRPYSFERAPSV